MDTGPGCRLHSPLLQRATSGNDALGPGTQTCPQACTRKARGAEGTSSGCFTMTIPILEVLLTPRAGPSLGSVHCLWSHMATLSQGLLSTASQNFLALSCT